MSPLLESVLPFLQTLVRIISSDWLDHIRKYWELCWNEWFTVNPEGDAKIRSLNNQFNWRTWSRGSIHVIGPDWAEGHWLGLECRLGFLEANDEMEFRVFIEEWQIWKEGEELNRLELWREYFFSESSWVVPYGITQSSNIDNSQWAWPRVTWLSVTEADPQNKTKQNKTGSSGYLLTAFPTAGQVNPVWKEVQAIYLCVDTVSIHRHT